MRRNFIFHLKHFFKLFDQFNQTLQLQLMRMNSLSFQKYYLVVTFKIEIISSHLFSSNPPFLLTFLILDYFILFSQCIDKFSDCYLPKMFSNCLKLDLLQLYELLFGYLIFHLFDVIKKKGQLRLLCLFKMLILFCIFLLYLQTFLVFWALIYLFSYHK